MPDELTGADIAAITDKRLKRPEVQIQSATSAVPLVGSTIADISVGRDIGVAEIGLGSAISAGLSTALPRTGAGLIRFPIVAPATQLAEEGVPGAEFVATQGTRLANYLDDTARAAEARKHPDFKVGFSQAILERPDLIFNPAWWAEDLIDVGVSFGASILAGLATAAITKNPVAATAVAVGVGGGLEASPVYDKVLQSSGDPDEAFKAGALMFGGVAALSSLPTGMLFQRLNARGLARKLPFMTAVAAGESITEALEEPLEAVITGEDVRGTVTQMIDVMPASFILSFLTAGVFSGVSSRKPSGEIINEVKTVPIEGSVESVQKQIDVLTEVVNDKQKLFNLGIAQQALGRGTAEGLSNARNIVDGVAQSMDRNPEEKGKLVEQAVGQLEQVADAALKEQQESQSVLEKILGQELPGEEAVQAEPVVPTPERVALTPIEQAEQILGVAPEIEVKAEPKPKVKPKVVPKEPELAKVKATTIPEFEKEVKAVPKNLKAPIASFKSTIGEVLDAANKTTNSKVASDLVKVASFLDTSFVDDVRKGETPVIDKDLVELLEVVNEDFALFAKTKSERAKKNKAFKAKAAATKVSGATVSDKEFTGKSDTHTTFLEFWRTLGELETIQPDQVEALKDIFKDIDLTPFENLELVAGEIEQEHGFLTAAYVPNTVQLIETQHPLPDNIIGQKFKKEGSITFLHELAHVWHRHIADKTLVNDISAAYKKFGKKEAKKYMLEVGFKESDAEYYASTDGEFFAQSFAIYALNRSVPSNEFLSLFQRVMQTIKTVADKLFESKSPNKELESLYERILTPAEPAKEPPRVTPVKYAKSQAELTPEEYEDVFDQLVAYMEGADGNTATLQQLVDWLKGNMYDVGEDTALIEAATLVDDDAFTVDGADDSPNTKVTLRERVDEQPDVHRTKAEIQNEIDFLESDLSTMIEELKADGSSDVDIDMDIVVSDIRREIAELKRKKKLSTLPEEPVSEVIVPEGSESQNKAKNWQDTLRDFRTQIAGVVKRYTDQQKVDEIEQIPEKWLDLKFPGIGKGNSDHTLTTMNDHVLFGNLLGAEVNMNSVFSKLSMPKLISRQAISQIPTELGDAARQLREATEYMSDLDGIGPFIDSILKSDARVVATRVEGIGRRLDEMKPYIKSKGEQKAFNKLKVAYRDIRDALTKYGITSNAAKPTGHDMRAVDSARDARKKGKLFSEWEFELNPERNPNMGKSLKLSWDLSRNATMKPVLDEEMAYKEYKVSPNGTVKATKATFVTKKMAEAIARYNGPDIRQSVLKPIIFLFEQMDKVVPGVGFAKLIDNYQAALRLDKEYTNRVINDMKKALAGVNTLELGMYAAVKDTKGMAGYLKAKKVDISAVMKRVANNDRAMEAYALGRKYFNEMWTDINATRIKLGLEPIPFRPDYFTFIRMNEELNANFSDMLTAKLSVIEGAFQSVQEALGNRRDQVARFQFTERKEGPKPIDLEYARVFQQYTRIASRHMHLSPTIMAVAELTGPMYIDTKNGEAPKAVGLRSAGADGMDNMIDQLNRWKSVLAGNPSRAEFGAGLPPGINKIIGRLTTNVATYTMGYANMTFVIQPTANYITALSIGPQYIYKNGFGGWAKWAFSGDKEVQRKLDLSNHLPTRTIEAQIEDVKDRLGNLTPTNAWESLQFFGLRVQSASFSIIQLFDMWTAKVGWLGVFDYAKDRGMNDNEARDVADRLIAKTHGSAAPGLRAPIQRSAVGRGITLFQTFQLNEFAYIVNEVLSTGSMTIPGQEQAQAKLEGLTEKLTAQGIAEENIDTHPEMEAMKKTLKNLGKMNTLDDMKKERIRRILLYLFLGVFINAFYEDFIGINSPLPAPIRGAWQAYANDDSAISIAAQPFLEVFKQVPIIGGGAYGGGLGGAGMDFIDDITDVLSGKTGAKRAPSELMGKLFGIPLLNQINKSIRSADQGGSNFEVAIGMYPGHRRLLMDIIENMSGSSGRVGF